jgi:hypothetical protein
MDLESPPEPVFPTRMGASELCWVMNEDETRATVGGPGVG